MKKIVRMLGVGLAVVAFAAGCNSADEMPCGCSIERPSPTPTPTPPPSPQSTCCMPHS